MCPSIVASQWVRRDTGGSPFRVTSYLAATLNLEQSFGHIRAQIYSNN